jgi:hypothetical protein
LTLERSGTLEVGNGLNETIGALASTSSSSNVQINDGASLTTGAATSSTYAGHFMCSGTLNKAGPGTSFILTGDSNGLTGTDFTGTLNVVGTLEIDGRLGTANAVNLTGPSSILQGTGTVYGPVIIMGSANGASVSGLSINSGGTGIDVEAPANNVSISAVTVYGPSVGILVEPGTGNMTSITDSTIGGGRLTA